VGGSLRRDGYTFTGWGRAATDDVGAYSFTTVSPGAPFIALTVFARGLMNRLFTRIYLPGTDTAADAFLLSVPADRRDTLVARRTPDGLRFDVVLQGDQETVFLTYPGH
jgi:protocatechuate 3,4-dioxygenase alpha subunit